MYPPNGSEDTAATIDKTLAATGVGGLEALAIVVVGLLVVGVCAFFWAHRARGVE